MNQHVHRHDCYDPFSGLPVICGMEAREGGRVKRLAAAIALVFIGTCLLVGQAGARPPAPTCWWEGTVLHGINMPDEYAVTLTPNPTGEFPGPSTYVQDFGFSTTAWFWTRGGPYTSIWKPDRQLRDYKGICVAVPEVNP